ncbi:Gluconolactonase [Cladorrhinum samala]|uniref:Gluconolactonase n=1 Tax=Cladorrhinum samala TaxID=585594 RepID=A0AAV9HJE5_9PEZI|nr:Gluconolactonase [Cladorrhinum samala]
MHDWNRAQPDCESDIACIGLMPEDIHDVPGRSIPTQAQVINQRSLNVLTEVLSVAEINGSSQFIPTNHTRESLLDRPFHIYDEEFLEIIGSNSTLTLISKTEGNPMFHEAAIWHPPTDEMFFCQNAGALAAGTGLKKSAIIQKISLSDINPSITSQRNATGLVKVEIVNSEVAVINPNGGTNYKDQILFLGEGQGDNIPPAIYLMSPQPPYKTKVILDNFFGRQFNSLNDASINPRNGEIYFTDPTYGHAQDFRPPPGLPKQVWRFNPDTGAVRVAADGFIMPNGIAFSSTGAHVYITDSAMAQGFANSNFSYPASIYRYDVQQDGTFENRKTFAFVSPGIPDGIHCDTKGNVYAGCGDGVHVFNPSGKLLGKIHIGGTVANFGFAGKGRMVILAETELYFATLAAEGAFPGKLY